MCEGDLVGWIDDRLAAVLDPSSADYPVRLGHSLIEPLRHVHGVSDKLLNMALSDLLIGADPDRPLWVLAGQHMIAIDSLVHNLLHRTGILQECNATHAYGPACYRPNGCESVVRRLAAEIDARHFHPSFPKCFPRFVQHALWQFCAQNGLNICNGNQIDDRESCGNASCPVFSACGRVALRPERAPKPAHVGFRARPRSR